MPKNTELASSILPLVLLGGTVQAQDAAPEVELQTVVVTGSLIRSERNDSQLITAIDGADLERIGATTASDALAPIMQNQVATVSATSAGLRTGFATYANLRSLGSSETLVLFNGKRIVNNPYQSLGVDLNSIPLNLINRIDVLSDGASSIYGSDAIAGVVNFITRPELTGFKVSVTRLQPESSGGGDSDSANVSGGFGSLANDGWNVFGGVTWRQRDALLMPARDFAATYFLPARGVNRLNNTTFPANWSQSVAGVTTVAGANPSRASGCMPPFSLPSGATTCGYDNALQGFALPEMEEVSVLAHGSVKLGGNILTLEYLRGQEELEQQISPNSMTSLVMPATSPFYPGNGIYPSAPGQNLAAPISLAFRGFESGSNQSSAKTVTDRALVQFTGFAAGIDYEVYSLYSTSSVDLDFLGGYLDRSRIVAGLAGTGGAPFLNPFGTQSAAGLQYLLDSRITGTMQQAESHLAMGGVQGSRDLMELPGGSAKVALALDYRRDDARFTNDPRLAQAAGSGLESSTDIAGDRNSYAATAELRLPLHEKLEVDLSARYDHYSDFGSTTNPKILVNFTPVTALSLHASYNTGFRAPTLYDVFASRATPISTTRRNDPVLCPGGVPAAGGLQTRDCNFQFLTLTGGNLNLDPQESDAWAAGFKLRPVESLSIAVDYWNYHLTQSIGTLSEAAIFADPAKYADLIVRCSGADPALLPFVPVCANNPSGDPIAYVVQTKLNLGDVKTDGFDVAIEWTSPPTSWGEFSVGYRGTKVSGFDFQREPGGPFFSRAGAYVDGFPVIDYSHYLMLRWARESFSSQIVNRYLASYEDCNAQCNIAAAFHQDVGAYSLLDLSATWSGIESFQVTMRVNNVLDRDPPFTNKTQGLGTGYEERYTDPLGRSYSLTLSYEF